MTTIEDRYYQPSEAMYTPINRGCLYEPDGTEDPCGEETEDGSSVCPPHEDTITWDEYRALQAHYEIA